VPIATRLLHRLRDSVSGIVYTASPGNKDVPGNPCRKRQLRRLPVSCATIGLLIELSRREDYELLPNLWNQLA